MDCPVGGVRKFEFVERRRTVLESLKQKVVSIQRIPSGFLSTQLSSLRLIERSNWNGCGFLAFDIDETNISAVRYDNATGPNRELQSKVLLGILGTNWNIAFSS